jgi:hypothetical protein
MYTSGLRPYRLVTCNQGTIQAEIPSSASVPRIVFQPSAPLPLLYITSVSDSHNRQ